MDIATIVGNEIVYEAVHPVTEQKIGLRIGLTDLNSPACKKVREEIENASRRLMLKRKTFSASEVADNGIKLIFAAMTNWEWGFVEIKAKNAKGEDEIKREECTFGGEKPAFNLANVTKVFTALPWLQSQLEEKLDENKAFFQS